MKVNVLSNESTRRKLRVLFLIGMAILLLSDPIYAQTATSSKLTTVKTVITNIVNVVFLIGMIYGLIKTVLALIGQKEGGLTNLMWLVAAAVVWVCFNLFMTDVGISSVQGIGGK